jgi:ketosteroid isomerase-like protein
MRCMTTLARRQWFAPVVLVALVGGAWSLAAPPTDSTATTGATAKSPLKQTVARYLDGFNRGDHQQILSCLTDDVEWNIPGMFHVRGKAAFDKEIENEAFVGRPKIATTRLVEEGEVVVAEGTVRAQKKEGGELHVRFCDVFIFRDGQIAKLTSYLMEVK